MSRSRLDVVALRAFLLSIRAAADAALSVLGSAQSPVQPTVQRSVQSQSRPSLDAGLDSGLDGRSSSENSSSPQDSEDLDEREEKREASPERALSTIGLAGLSVGLDSGLKPGQHVTGAALANCWDGIGGLGCNGATRAAMVERLPLIEKLATERGIAPLVLFQRACDRFKADPSIAGKRLKTARVLLDQLENWVDDVKPPPPSGAAPALVSPARRLLNPPPAKDAS